MGYNPDMVRSLAEMKARLKAKKAYLYDRYGVIEVGVFGSYVRGEQRPDSDIDILIDLTDPPQIDLFDLVELEHYLSDLLEKKADVVLKRNLRKRIGQRILQEVQPI